MKNRSDEKEERERNRRQEMRVKAMGLEERVTDEYRRVQNGSRPRNWIAFWNWRQQAIGRELNETCFRREQNIRSSDSSNLEQPEPSKGPNTKWPEASIQNSNWEKEKLFSPSLEAFVKCSVSMTTTTVRSMPWTEEWSTPKHTG